MVFEFDCSVTAYIKREERDQETDDKIKLVMTVMMVKKMNTILLNFSAWTNQYLHPVFYLMLSFYKNCKVRYQDK